MTNKQIVRLILFLAASAILLQSCGAYNHSNHKSPFRYEGLCTQVEQP